MYFTMISGPFNMSNTYLVEYNGANGCQAFQNCFARLFLLDDAFNNVTADSNMLASLTPDFQLAGPRQESTDDSENFILGSVRSTSIT